MAEELQHPDLDRIQKDAVEAAEKQATQILAQAREKAAAVVKEAEEKARAFLAKAEKDAEAFTERSTRTLEQAARDLLISVGQGVENILADVVDDSVGKALRPEVLEQMLVKMAEAVCVAPGRRGPHRLAHQPAGSAGPGQVLRGTVPAAAGSRSELHVDSGIFKGFKVSFGEQPRTTISPRRPSRRPWSISCGRSSPRSCTASPARNRRRRKAREVSHYYLVASLPTPCAG